MAQKEHNDSFENLCLKAVLKVDYGVDTLICYRTVTWLY